MTEIAVVYIQTCPKVNIQFFNAVTQFYLKSVPVDLVCFLLNRF